MTDDIVISGGGWIGVATADQLHRVRRIERFRDDLRGMAGRLVAVRGSLSMAELRAANAPAPAFAVPDELDWVIADLTRAADEANLVASLTRTAMALYGAAEHTQNVAMHRLADQIGFFAGRNLPWLVVAASPFVVNAAVAAVGGAAITAAVTGTSPEQMMTDLSNWLAYHPGVLNNAAVVNGLDLVTGAIDDGEMGFVRLPPVVATTVGDSGLGLTGPDTAAASIVAAGSGLGLLRESAVSISSKLDKNIAANPQTYRGRIERIPDTGSNGGAQILIDKNYKNGKLIGCDIYLSGTQAWDIRGTDTPFDLTSNVRATGNMANGSLAAVELAMAASGIDRNTPITVTGHSQGGILAHEVAATGRYNVVAVLEAGAPAVHTPLPKGTPEVDLVHDEDIVPALGGARDSADAIVVTGTAYPDDAADKSDKKPKTPNLISAHDVDRYEDTAAALDDVDDPRVAAAAVALNSTGLGATSITSTLYTAERVPGK